MRGSDRQTGKLFSYASPETLVPQDHPLRAIRLLVNLALDRLSPVPEAHGRATRAALSLGRVDKPDPDTDAAEQDEAEKTGGGVIVSRGDPALVLQLAEEAFDACP